VRVPAVATTRSTRTLQAVGLQERRCAQCGAETVDTIERRHKFRYGAGESAAELTVDLPVRRCGTCGFEFLDRESEKIKLEAICEHLGVLSPSGIRRVRERYGMTQAEFAEVTGLGTATLVRWENGSMNHTRAYDRYMRLLESPEVMRRLRELAQPVASRNKLAQAVDDGGSATQTSEHVRGPDQAAMLLSPIALCRRLHEFAMRLERHTFPIDDEGIPGNGLYLLFEKGECGHGADRIVRVGSHRGENNLVSRLREHFVKPNKDRSIFRKNIGRAILNVDHDPFLREWDLDLTTRDARERYGQRVNLERQRKLELNVSKRIQESFSFVVLPVHHRSERLRLESNIISIVSLCNECRPSGEWLGSSSPETRIRESGLWQKQGLYKQLTHSGLDAVSDDLDEIEALINGDISPAAVHDGTGGGADRPG
jgi:putative zinc finger/helix-turn-helix YgiT family protein